VKRKDGLTIIEVLVALTVLATGILAVAAFQTSSLHATQKAGVYQQLASLAKDEVEAQRRITHAKNVESYAVCQSLLTPRQGYACKIDVLPCQYGSSTNKLTCSTTSLTSVPDAHQITVVVSGPEEARFTLRSLIAYEIG
jgi:type IV pilus modification protein PilV